MHIDLSGKRVIVTGASRGIGRAIARAFAADGARVALCARSVADIQAVGQDLAASAQAVIARAVDVTDTAAVKTFVDEVASAWGGVDVLVNNAGQGRGGNLDTLTPEQILEHANVLQMGHFRFIQAVVPHMRRQHWGRIIEINALAGAIPTPDGIPSVINRASCIALAGSVVGLLFGVGTSRIINAHYQALYRTPLLFSLLTPGTVGFAIVLSVVLGIGAGGLAARRLTKRPPLSLLGR